MVLGVVVFAVLVGRVARGSAYTDEDEEQVACWSGSLCVTQVRVRQVSRLLGVEAQRTALA